jgi:hypothetical protein
MLHSMRPGLSRCLRSLRPPRELILASIRALHETERVQGAAETPAQDEEEACAERVPALLQLVRRERLELTVRTLASLAERLWFGRPNLMAARSALASSRRPSAPGAAWMRTAARRPCG